MNLSFILSLVFVKVYNDSTSRIKTHKKNYEENFVDVNNIVDHKIG